MSDHNAVQKQKFILLVAQRKQILSYLIVYAYLTSILKILHRFSNESLTLMKRRSTKFRGEIRQYK